MKRLHATLVACALGWSGALLADNEFTQCLMAEMADADDSVTIGELRQRCEAKQNSGNGKPSAASSPKPLVAAVTEEDKEVTEEEPSAIARRLRLENDKVHNPFSLMPHKPNYIILSNNMGSPHEAPFRAADPGDDVNFQPWETKFQISLKLPVVRGLFDNRADLFVAYTNRSFWQQFNKEGSAPFRESDHEPEIWLSFRSDAVLFGLKNSIIRTGFSHQSNGQSGELSRSWNRVYADFIFEHEDLYLSFKPWWRVPEDRDNDDNPDIDEYMGNFELGALYKLDNHTFEAIIRNNLDFGENYGAVQLGWSFPLNRRVRGYVQWFNGYGESLIDYNAHTNSIGFGVQLSDWL